MKFDSKRVEATKGAKGMCPICGTELVAKCGQLKINHWAHKGIRTCDAWWESETEWHRKWKDNFATEWQEFPLVDQVSGEKHFADVRTSHGIVIEFQHSYIDPQERISREKFYKTMVWVVDGTRAKNDFKRFLKGKDNFQKTNNRGFYFVNQELCLPPAWLESSVPILFDFRGVEPINDPNGIRNSLYCLFPKQIESGRLIVELSPKFFIDNIMKGEWLSFQRTSVNFEKQWQYQMERMKAQQASSLFYLLNLKNQNRRRRF